MFLVGVVGGVEVIVPLMLKPRSWPKSCGQDKMGAIGVVIERKEA